MLGIFHQIQIIVVELRRICIFTYLLSSKIQTWRKENVHDVAIADCLTTTVA